jgi:hypothetical protein
MQLTLLLPCCFAVLGAMPALVASSSLPNFDLSFSALSSLQTRKNMDRLSKQLLDIVAAFAPSSPLESRGDSLSQAIKKSASTLDTIGTQSIGSVLSDGTRTGLACKAAQLVFGERAIFPEDALYKEEQQENW